MPLKNFLILSVFVIFLGFVQFAGIEIFGVKPNFILSGLMAAMFFISDFWQGILLTLFASLMLKFSPQVSDEIIVLFVVGLLVSVSVKRLPARPLIGVLVLTAVGTLLMYLFLFLATVGSAVFFKELAYNLILGSGVYYLLKKIMRNYE